MHLEESAAVPGRPDGVGERAWARALTLLRAARADGRRRVLGLAGAPGAGKSTVAAALGTLPGTTVVGMDGWHLASSALDGLGRRGRKGAPDTFDGDGYVAFLARVRDRDVTVWAPQFRREIEEPVAGAIAVPPTTGLLVTEGNYLLVDEAPWDAVRGLLDEAWFLAPPEGLRRDRLVARHVRYGRTRADAVSRADGSDAANARLVAATRSRADLVLTSGG